MLTSSWLALLALGAGHGINPAMGWLFAVALGLQEGRARAVWRALPPLAAGHAAAVAVAALAALALGQVLSPAALEWLVATLLIGLGVQRLRRHRHPRGGGMRVGFRDLTVWSFLMASVHGAGLMVLPLLIGGEAGPAHGAHALHAALLALPPDAATGLWAAAVHTSAYLVVTGAIALVFYWKLGLRRLGTVWVNVDLLWGGALIATGTLTVLG